jgi:uncharacterized protein YegL
MGYDRRLPVYLLIDCSESMAGNSFAAVTQGLSAIITQLRSNPMALETAALSVITFASTAQQVVPLTDILKFQMPRLKMGSGTVLGEALRLWLDCMDRELVKTTAEQKGDYKPICFLLTDGEPTDKWEDIADRIRTTIVGKRANLVAVACGSDVDTSKLRRITESVLVLKDAEPAAFAAFFRWVSASISTASQRLDGGGGGANIEAPNLPPNVEVATPAQEQRPVPDRYVFLHLRCVKNGEFYILRYEKQKGSERAGQRGAMYKAVEAHQVADFDFGQGEQGTPQLQVSSNQLQGSQPCPYCRSQAWAMCANGHLHCYPNVRERLSLTCPWCKVVSVYAADTFDVGRGVG